MEEDTLVKLAEDKIELGKGLIEKLQEFQQIDGVPKVQRKIQQEIKFLEKVRLFSKLNFLLVLVCTSLPDIKFSDHQKPKCQSQ